MPQILCTVAWRDDEQLVTSDIRWTLVAAICTIGTGYDQDPLYPSKGRHVMAEVTPDPILRIAMGFMAAKHLFVASEIGLFTGLAQGPATLDQLAATCSIPLRTAGISADAMVSLGLLERDGARYRNSETAATFLAGQAGPDLRPMLRFWNRISYPGWLALEDAVRAGAGQAKFGQFTPEEQLIFSA